MSNIFERIKPIFIENWSPDLKELSIPQTDIPLNLEEAHALGLVNKEFSNWFGFGSIKPIHQIETKIDIALNKYPEGAFVRLGSRSGKDSSYAYNRGLKVTDGSAAVRMLTENTYRIAFDLRLALHNNYLPHIFVRQWQEIPVWSEFRCFMKNGKLVGISQYDCKNLGHCPEIAKNAERIKTAITDFFEAIRIGSHIDDVVFDVFVKFNEQNHNIPVKVQLLELNPFFPKTDACLFNWKDDGDFDGSFRFL